MKKKVKLSGIVFMLTVFCFAIALQGANSDPSNHGAGHQPRLRNDFIENGRFIQIPGPNPILKPGSDSWDDSRVECAGIFKDFGTYYLYYHASGSRGSGYQVGVATSTSPLGPFEKYAGNPILPVGPPGSWDDNDVACAIIIKEPLGQYYLWYCGQGPPSAARPGRSWDIGLATASHPLGPWTKYAGNPIIDDFGYNSGCVKVDGKYYLYSAYPIGSSPSPPDYSPMAVATADAPEGPWTIYPANPILKAGNWGEWDDGGFSDGAVIYSTGVFHMFYAGAKQYEPRLATRESLGYAYSFDGYHWEKYGRNPIATRQANPGAAAFAEPRALFEMPFIYVYHTLRYEDPARLVVEDLGVQVLVTQTPFSFDMPVLVTEKLAAGANTRLEESPPVCLSNIKGVAITAQCKYDKNAKKSIRLHIVSSTDGFVYDTTDLYTFDNDFKPGKTARKTFDLNTNVRFIKIIVENQDMSKSVSELKITATLKG